MKKLLLLLLLLLFALTSAVWGEEVYIVSPGGGGSSQEGEEDEETYIFDTLAEALAEALGSEESDILIEIDADQELDGVIEIDDSNETLTSITIRGTGSNRITNTTDAERHFIVNNKDFTLGLRGVTLYGRDAGGGVLVMAGTVSADNVTFRACNATNLDDEDDHMGGAVALKGEDSLGKFRGCSFSDNISDTGGAVYTDRQGTAEFSGSSEFSTNTSSSSGGAVHSEGALTFAGAATFETNTASTNGGAIALISSSSNTFTGMTFGGGSVQRANKAVNGGAVYMGGGGTLTLVDAAFNLNSADLGGGLYVDDGGLHLDNGNSFTDNRASRGGALYLANNESVVLTFEGTTGATFTANSASEWGGAIYAERSAKLSFHAPVVFADNKAPNGGGGALWVHMGSQLNDITSALTFRGNTAQNGGALYVAINSQSVLNLNNSQGGSYIFDGNEATEHGGAIYTVRADVALAGMDIETGNTAGLGGGFLRSGGTTTVNSSTISGQKAMYGGAIYSDGTVTIDNSIFSGNSTAADETSSSSPSGGGALFASGKLTVTSSDFNNNFSVSSFVRHGGGAIFVSGDADISRSTFTNNHHTNDENIDNGGGAILVNGVLNAETVRFDGNRATGRGASRGGAVYAINGSALTITDCYFTGNSSNNNGGAIALTGQCATTVDRSSFYNNASGSAHGGAVYAQGVISLNSSFFRMNRSAMDGGAVFLDQHNSATNPGRFTAEGCMFMENSAGAAPSEGRGGALYLKPDVATINRCTFNSNNSSASGGDSRGGAIYLDTNDSAVFTPSSIKNSMFTDNKVTGGTTNYGGAVYLTGENITLVSDAFALNNTAVERGGAVYLGSGSMTIAATIIVGNAADLGRDIYAEGTITSLGYSRIGVYGKGGNDTSWLADITTSNTDRESSAWTTTTFYGENAALTDNDGYVQAPEIGSSLEENTVYLLALPLHELDSLSEQDRATNAIPYARRFTLNIDELDIWGVNRFTGQNPISCGPHYLGGEGGGGGGNQIGLYEIASITMSGIPNTLRSIGQSASLIAVIKYINGRTALGVPYDAQNVVDNQQERITWESSIPSALKVDKDGNITALRLTSGTNGATITVRTVRTMSSGAKATDSRAVRITGQYSSLNVVSTTFQNYFSGYVQDLMEHDISVSLADPDTSTIATTGFQRNFASLWGSARASAITVLNTSTPRFDTVYTYNNSEGLAASKGAAVNITFQNRGAGDLFPLTYSWNLTGDQVKALMGADMTSQTINDAFAERLFSAARIDYQTVGASHPVIGGSGVSGSDARRYGALSMTKADSNRGLHIELTAYLANVKTTGSKDGPQFVKGSGTRRILVVPDNADDGAITGTMWLAQKAGTVVPQPGSNSGNGGSDGNSGGNTSPSPDNSGGSSSGGGGGGGGCSALPLGAICAGLVILLRRKH